MTRVHLISACTILLLSLGLSGQLMSQNLINNNGVAITIQPGASLQINGDIHVNGDSILDNNGAIYLTGDLSSNGNYPTKGNGSTLFRGNQDQYITGTSLLKFENLNVDKSSGFLTLLTDIEVLGNINMVSGKLDIANNHIFLRETGQILNETNDNYITGSAGTIVAIGDLNAPSNQDIGNVGASVTSSTNFGTTLVVRLHQPQTLGGEEGIKRCYSFTPQFDLPSTSNLEFKYVENAMELNFLPEAELLTFKLDSISNWMGLSTTVDTPNNRIIINEQKKLGIYTFGLGNAALPVEYTNFSAKAINNHSAQLDWTTVTEINNDFFTIERSENGFEFTEIARMEGAGNSNEEQNYQYLDTEALTGLSYYRIKQTDFDGKFDYSVIRAVTIDEELEESYSIDLYPNPLKHNTIQISGIESDAGFQLFDGAGKMIFETKLSPNSVMDINKIVIPGLNAGLYLYNLTTETGDFHRGSLVKL